MSFILRIYFIGLMAFVPNPNGKQMTVLMIDARQGYHASDGTFFPKHYPALVAPAKRCAGACEGDQQAVADHLFSRGAVVSGEENLRQIKGFLDHGGAWEINGEEITVDLPAGGKAKPSPSLQVISRKPASRGASSPLLPASSSERESFSWVASLDEIMGAPKGTAKVDPDCLAAKPADGLIAGRMRLSAGTLKTYRMVQFKDGVPQFSFQALAEGAQPSRYTQGLADIVAVDIPVSGCEVTLKAKKLADGTTRTMTLSPGDCSSHPVLEVALMDLPDELFRPRGEQEGHQHEVSSKGTHFEMYYELLKVRPSWRQRAVPQATAKTVPPSQVDPQDSEFLEKLGVPRAGGYSQPICPQAVFAASPDA